LGIEIVLALVALCIALALIRRSSLARRRRAVAFSDSRYLD